MIGEEFILDNLGKATLRFKPDERERTHIICKRKREEIMKFLTGKEEEETNHDM